MWCHDYTWSQVTKDDVNKKSPDALRTELVRRRYVCFSFTTAAHDPAAQPRLRSGDVFIFGDAHSGIVNEKRLIDHYVQAFGKSIRLSSGQLKQLEGGQYNLVQLSYESGYKELGGRTHEAGG